MRASHFDYARLRNGPVGRRRALFRLMPASLERVDNRAVGEGTPKLPYCCAMRVS